MRRRGWCGAWRCTTEQVIQLELLNSSEEVSHFQSKSGERSRTRVQVSEEAAEGAGQRDAAGVRSQVTGEQLQSGNVEPIESDQPSTPARRR